MSVFERSLELSFTIADRLAGGALTANKAAMEFFSSRASGGEPVFLGGLTVGLFREAAGHALLARRLTRRVDFRPSLEAVGDIDFETELSWIITDISDLKTEHRDLVRGFPPEFAEDDEPFGFYSTEIPYILDFSKVVPFAQSGDGAQFCFDFRDDINNPSIIWWADVTWIRVSNDIEGFVDLFD